MCTFVNKTFCCYASTAPQCLPQLQFSVEKTERRRASPCRFSPDEKMSRSAVARPQWQKVRGNKPQGARLRTTRTISRSEVETRRLRARPGASRSTGRVRKDCRENRRSRPSIIIRIWKLRNRKLNENIRKCKNLTSVQGAKAVQLCNKVCNRVWQID